MPCRLCGLSGHYGHDYGECDKEKQAILEKLDTLGHDTEKAHEFDEARFKANCWLLNTLAELVNKHKDLRFGQILENYGFVQNNEYTDAFTELYFWNREILIEPQVVVERVKKRMEDLKK